MYDYDGDMAYYQDQLSEIGITKQQLNMDNYAGLTARELQGIVDNVKRRHAMSQKGATT